MNLSSGARGECVVSALAIFSLIKPWTFAEGSSPFVHRGINTRCELRQIERTK